MKKIIYASFIAVLLFNTGCGKKKSGPWAPDAINDTSQELIEKNIEEMGEGRWDKELYLDILKNQIEAYDDTQNAKDGLRSKLNHVYGKVLVKEGNLLMDDNCGNNHGKLGQVMAELKNFPNAEDAAELNKRYQEHQEMMNFISSMSAKQPVSSYSVGYDYSFESRIKSQAAAYLKKDIKCSYIKSRLSNPNFAERRRDYCNKIVDLFCQQTSFNQGAYNTLKSNVINVNGSIAPWEGKLASFKAKYASE